MNPLSLVRSDVFVGIDVEAGNAPTSFAFKTTSPTFPFTDRINPPLFCTYAICSLLYGFLT